MKKLVLSFCGIFRYRNKFAQAKIGINLGNKAPELIGKVLLTVVLLNFLIPVENCFTRFLGSLVWPLPKRKPYCCQLTIIKDKKFCQRRWFYHI
jgi:hypothetical protein